MMMQARHGFKAGSPALLNLKVDDPDQHNLYLMCVEINLPHSTPARGTDLPPTRHAPWHAEDRRSFSLKQRAPGKTNLAVG
jgi:hypothetical protein